MNNVTSERLSRPSDPRKLQSCRPLALAPHSRRRWHQDFRSARPAGHERDVRIPFKRSHPHIKQQDKDKPKPTHLRKTMDIDSIPPITRIWAGLAVGTALAEYVHVVSEYQLWFSFRLVFQKLELWRVLTCFVYFGPFGLDFIFHLFFFMRYSRMLEENSYAGRKADFAYLLLFSSALLLLLSPLASQPFLGGPLAFVLVYIWSRRNRHIRLSLFGLVNITAPYLPWSLVAFGWILHGSMNAVAADLMGIAVGHLCELTKQRCERK
jgi:Derlin-2/3